MPRESAVPVVVRLDVTTGVLSDHDPETPLVHWDDSVVVRGDGVFETLLVHRHRVCNGARHMARLASSARLIGLPDPTISYWEAAMRRAARRWSASAGDDVDGRLVCTYTRGRESTGVPSAWVTVSPVGCDILRQRANGVRVLTAERGVSLGALEGRPPWLIVGAKTLNYAATMAALRYARDNDADDVIFIDGSTVVEGATSTVVLVNGRTLRTPGGRPDILPGTTQAALFDTARSDGWECRSEQLSVDDLRIADSVWLVSSVRLAARVTALDGRALRARGDVAAVTRLLTKALLS